MPTFHIGGFRMRFYSNDHEPAHIHCSNGDGVVVVEIVTGAIMDLRGKMKPADIARAVQLVSDNHDKLLTEWNLFDLRRRDVR
jgi:hypothetical protein